MKYLAALLILFSASAVSAQTTAMDWTRTDCDGNSHTLFSELESGNVVVLEFVMMNCSPCVNAGNGLKSILEPYAASHPGKVKLYSIGFENFYTCDDMNSWKSDAGFSHPVFTGGKSEVNYYGGMGMPTIVVVGGWGHEVVYKTQGYMSSKNAAITAAIDQALATAGVQENELNASINLYPNPAGNKLFLSASYSGYEVQILDLTGRQLISHISHEDNCELDTEALKPGMYIAHVTAPGRGTVQLSFIKAE